METAGNQHVSNLNVANLRNVAQEKRPSDGYHVSEGAIIQLDALVMW